MVGRRLYSNVFNWIIMYKKMLLSIIMFPVGFFVFLYMYAKFDDYFDNKMESKFIDFLESKKIGESVDLTYFLDEFNLNGDGYFCLLREYESKLYYKNNINSEEKLMYLNINKKLDENYFRNGFFGFIGFENKWGFIIFDKDFNKFHAYEISNKKTTLIGDYEERCFSIKNSYIYKEINDKNYGKYVSNYGLRFSSKSNR